VSEWGLGEDLRPDRAKRPRQRAARDRLASLLVVDGHLYPLEHAIAAAEGRFAGGEPHQQGFTTLWKISNELCAHTAGELQPARSA